MNMATQRPNYLIIVADDLGYTDLSCYGSEIRTPNIDSLASAPGGLRFTAFHVAAACSPTRAMLLTGTDHHLTGLGQLAEFVRNSPAHQGRPGHEGYLNDRVVAMPELLREGGYHTMMAGKWHLGLKPEYGPRARGFERSFALLPGCANHYGWEPGYESDEEPPRFFETAVTALHMEDGEYVKELPGDFYSSDAYATKLIEYLDARSDEEKAKPFLAYLPFSAPHWPLQAPKESMGPYRGLYDSGPEALRLRRLAGLRTLGLLDPQVAAHDFVSVGKEPGAWTTLSDDERALSARSMEAYAGMVARMDDNVGRVLDSLRRSGEYDSTMIFFMSDNGAEGASYEARDMIREDILAHIEKYYDNSLGNIGRKDSFVWYGNRWAQAATAPGRLYKMFSTEGGCRVPMVLKPAAAALSEAPGTASRGDHITSAFCTVQDILPTLLTYSSIPHRESWKGRPTEPLRGTSWQPYLTAIRHPDPRSPTTTPALHDPHAIHPATRAFGSEIAGSASLRRGRYKITYVPLPHGPQKWEMYDILSDPGETRDLSGEEGMEGEFAAMKALWERYKGEVGVVGLRGKYQRENHHGGRGGVQDEFEDTGRWMRWIGREGGPEGVEGVRFW